VRDDPEGQEVLDELCAAWRAVHADIQRDVAVLVLPMSSRKENALMVNAIQRCSTLVAQCSLREGFGLTAAEAMWKGVPVLGTSAAGLRAQIRPGVDGDLVDDPEDEEEIAAKLDAMLADAKARETWSDNARRRVAEEFLVFAQVQRWLDTLADAVSG
jgi:trehalose synthase